MNLAPLYRNLKQGSVTASERLPSMLPNNALLLNTEPWSSWIPENWNFKWKVYGRSMGVVLIAIINIIVS